MLLVNSVLLIAKNDNFISRCFTSYRIRHAPFILLLCIVSFKKLGTLINVLPINGLCRINRITFSKRPIPFFTLSERTTVVCQRLFPKFTVVFIAMVKYNRAHSAKNEFQHGDTSRARRESTTPGNKSNCKFFKLTPFGDKSHSQIFCTIAVMNIVELSSVKEC